MKKFIALFFTPLEFCLMVLILYGFSILTMSALIGYENVGWTIKLIFFILIHSIGATIQQTKQLYLKCVVFGHSPFLKKLVLGMPWYTLLWILIIIVSSTSLAYEIWSRGGEIVSHERYVIIVACIATIMSAILSGMRWYFWTKPMIAQLYQQPSI